MEFGVSKTIGLRGDLLRRSHDGQVIRYLQDHFIDYYVGVEYGGCKKMKNANENMHDHCTILGTMYKIDRRLAEVEIIKKKFLMHVQSLTI